MRILSEEKIENEELEIESLRPQKLVDYVGQKDIKEMLDVFIKAAKKRNESLDHVLLYGPPGLGKTTLAKIIANELEVNFKAISGPAIEKPGDLASILSSIQAGDVLFIDEIHRLPKIAEEILYSAMEDFYIDVLIGKDETARSIRLDIPPFTLVGATTRFGDLSSPLRERFGLIHRLNYYDLDDLFLITKRTARVFEVNITDESAVEIAKRSRGTPRICNRLFKRVRDFSEIIGDGNVDLKITNYALNKLKVSNNGLDELDFKYLNSLIKDFDGGPVGIETISVSISEVSTTVEDVYEPFLIKEGYIKRTSRGRIATKKAYDLLGVKYYEGML